jgi:hypothetical protein
MLRRRELGGTHQARRCSDMGSGDRLRQQQPGEAQREQPPGGTLGAPARHSAHRAGPVVGPVLWAHVGPQSVHDVLAVQAMVRRERQQLDQALDLAQRPFPLIDRPGFHGHAESAE